MHFALIMIFQVCQKKIRKLCGKGALKDLPKVCSYLFAQNTTNKIGFKAAFCKIRTCIIIWRQKMFYYVFFSTFDLSIPDNPRLNRLESYW